VPFLKLAIVRSGAAQEFLHAPILPAGDPAFAQADIGHLEGCLGRNVVIYSHTSNYSNFPQVAGPAGVASWSHQTLPRALGGPN
jgi:hypothetical protein